MKAIMITCRIHQPGLNNMNFPINKLLYYKSSHGCKRITTKEIKSSPLWTVDRRPWTLFLLPDQIAESVDGGHREKVHKPPAVARITEKLPGMRYIEVCAAVFKHE
jgi:hypothetical protein